MAEAVEAPMPDGDERGSAQDDDRSTKEVGDGGRRVKMDGVGSWHHHSDEGIVIRARVKVDGF